MGGVQFVGSVPCVKLTKQTAVALIGCLDFDRLPWSYAALVKDFLGSGRQTNHIDGGLACFMHDRQTCMIETNLPGLRETVNRITAPPTLADVPVNN